MASIDNPPKRKFLPKLKKLLDGRTDEANGYFLTGRENEKYKRGVRKTNSEDNP